MTRLDLVGIRRWCFLASGASALAALVLLAIPPALRPGIEFTSGTAAHLRFSQAVSQTDLRSAYSSLGHPEARIQATADNEFLVHTSELHVPEGSFSEVAPSAQAPVGPTPLPVLGTVRLGASAGATGTVRLRLPFNNDLCNFGNSPGDVPVNTEGTVRERHPECAQGAVQGVVLRVDAGGVSGYVLESDTHDFAATPAPAEATVGPGGEVNERAVIDNALRARFGTFDVLEFSTISPVVSRVAVRNAAVAVLMASLFIMAYIAFAFSAMPRPFRYGVCAIVALLHDVIIVLGAFSLFGKLFHVEVNLMFVTGLLTVIGFSVHDTIVVFDRIRENVRAAPSTPFAANVNAALLQTLSRSINTSFTVLLTVLALLLLGGVTIQSFLLVILIGVISGTYSSIGVASQLLVSWEQGELARWLRLPRRRRAQPQPPA